MLIRRRMFVFCFSFFVSSLIFSSLSQSAKLVSAAFFACALAVSALLLRRCSADGDKRKNSPFRCLTEKNKIRIFAVFFSSLLLASLFSAFTFFRCASALRRAPAGRRTLSAITWVIALHRGVRRHKADRRAQFPRGGAVIRKIVPVREDQDIYRKGCRSAVRRASHRRPLRTSG